MARRFNYDADSFEEAQVYFETRETQLQSEEFNLIATKDLDWGAEALYEKFGVRYVSVYVYKSHRGQNHLREYFTDKKVIAVTTRDCEMEEMLEHIEQPFIVAGAFTETAEYKWIQSIYGNGTAERSGIPLMNHIDEGLRILNELNANDEAKRAYCLHPIFQEDSAFEKVDRFPDSINPKAVMLAMEYRRVANAYLSRREISSLDEIELSPHYEVNQMLVADKVQNYKDFMTYHHDVHERSDELYEYFHNWFTRLECDHNKLLKLIEFHK